MYACVHVCVYVMPFLPWREAMSTSLPVVILEGFRDICSILFLACFYASCYSHFNVFESKQVNKMVVLETLCVFLCLWWKWRIGKLGTPPVICESLRRRDNTFDLLWAWDQRLWQTTLSKHRLFAGGFVLFFVREGKIKFIQTVYQIDANWSLVEKISCLSSPEKFPRWRELFHFPLR